MNIESFVQDITSARLRYRKLSEEIQAQEVPPPHIILQTLEELQASAEELRVAEEELSQQNEELILSRTELEAERQRYQDLFELAPFGYLITDSHGVIQEANQAAAQLLGRSANYLVGKPIAVFVPPSERTAFRTNLLRVAGSEDKLEWETRIERRDKENPHVALTVAPSHPPQTGLRWLLRDVSPLRQQEQSLQTKISQVLELNWNIHNDSRQPTRLQEESASVVQEGHLQALQYNSRLQRAMMETHHRVKNNLQIIVALVEMEMEEAGELMSVEAVRQITGRVRALATMHDILTQQAQQNEIRDTLSLRMTLTKLIPSLQAAANREIVFEIEHDVELPIEKITSLSLIVNELVSNALKYSREPVQMVFTLLEDGQAMLYVRDHGPGFSPDFDSRVDAHVGLELVESLMRHDLGGSVKYVNHPDGGAQVLLSFFV